MPSSIDSPVIESPPRGLRGSRTGDARAKSVRGRSDRRLEGREARPRVLAVVAALWLLLPGSHGASAADWELRLASNNDALLNNDVRDDFYTFGARLEVSVGHWTVDWRENAFTDRVEGFRFDESYLTVGRLLPPHWLGSWFVWIEAGGTHVGEGLLGQSFQNDVHELTGDDPIVLDYLDLEDWFAHLDLEVGRQWRIVGDDWSWGPQFGIGTSIDFRTNAMAGIRTIWRPSRKFGLDVILGARFADTELAVLEPHLEQIGPAALVEIDLPWGLYTQWSLNRYGTQRRHFSFGIRIGPERSPRRDGAWIEVDATP